MEASIIFRGFYSVGCLRYCEGVTPYMALKARVKLLFSSNPHRMATSAIVWFLGESSSCLALFMRTCCIYLAKLSPVMAVILRLNCLELMHKADAISLMFTSLCCICE